MSFLGGGGEEEETRRPGDGGGSRKIISKGKKGLWRRLREEKGIHKPLSLGYK